MTTEIAFSHLASGQTLLTKDNIRIYSIGIESYQIEYPDGEVEYVNRNQVRELIGADTSLEKHNCTLCGKSGAAHEEGLCWECERAYELTK